jgi:hypothetical protein
VGSHAPSQHLAACEPCRSGDHGNCTAVHDDAPGTNPPFDCTCYDDRWEWHERLGYQADVGLTQTLGDHLPGGDGG